MFVALPLVLGTSILSPLNVAVALAIYSIALLVRSVVDGLRSVPDAVKQSATAVGFGWFRRFARVELPLAMPVIFAGLRVATVSNIALVSVAAMIGAGALGKLFDRGLSSRFYTPLIVGLVLSVALALAFDGLILLIQRRDPALGEKAAAGMNIFAYLQDPANWLGPDNILDLLLQHLAYTAASVAIGAAIAIPLGILIGHTGRGSFLVIGLSNGARAIPSLGLLVLVVLLLGTGFFKTVFVLTLLALPAILTATAAGIHGADREAVHAARALGMTEGQVVSKVEWPLAVPLVISGLRSATLQVVATATVAAFVGGGGLGRLLITGQRTNDYPQMFAGAFLIALLAIVLDLLLGAIAWLAARRARPRTKTTPSYVLAST